MNTATTIGAVTIKSPFATLNSPAAIRSATASVSTIMSGTRIVIDADEDTEEAVDLMIENKMGALVVIDPEGDIAGLVSYPDVMDCSSVGPDAWR